MRILKSVLIVAGTLSLAIGITGIFIPGLPTTPFLLLTAWLYLRSSEKLYYKLVRNTYIGPYILEYNRKKGMTVRAKIYSIIFMWIMIAISCFFLIRIFEYKIIVIIIGLTGTIVLSLIITTRKNGD